MSTAKKSARLEMAETRILTPSLQSGVIQAIDELHVAIDKLRMQIHSSKHPLDKIRFYEEIKMLKDELSELEKIG
jgi:hypothetical protein